MNILSLLAQSLTPMNPTNIKHSLTILWQGLLSIFVVIGLIIVAVQITKFCVNKAEKIREAKKQKSSNEDGDNLQ